MTGSLDLDGSSDCPISNFSPCNVVLSTHILCKKALLTRKWLLDERDVTVNFEKRKGANGKTRVSRHIRSDLHVSSPLHLVFTLLGRNSCSSPFIELRKGLYATYRAAQLTVE